VPSYRATRAVRADPDALFEYLSEVTHVPTWVPWIIEAEPSEDHVVQVTGELDTGGGPPQRVTADARYAPDPAARAVDFAVGLAGVRGRIAVQAQDAGAEVTITVEAPRTDGVDVDASLREALTHIAALTDGMRAPG
jgi:hypothetical protein